MIWLGFVLPLAYLAPNHYSPWIAFHQEMLAGIAFFPLIFLSLINWVRAKEFSLVWWIPLLSAIPFLQMIGGKVIYFSDALVPGLYLLGFGLLLCLRNGFLFIKNADDAIEYSTPAFYAIILSGVFSVIFQIHQWLNLGWLGVFIVDLKFGERPYGNLAQPNQLATLLLLGLLSLFCLYGQKKISAAPALLIAVLLSFGTAMTQSRAAAISAVAVSVALVWLMYRKKISAKTGFKGVLISLSLYCVIFLGWGKINSGLLLSDSLGISYERFNREARLNIWPLMLDAVGQSPWLGYGWNQVSTAQQEVALDHFSLHLYLESAHNVFIDLMLWAGLPASVGITFVFILLLSGGIAKIKTEKELAVLLMLMVVLVHAFFEYPLSYSYFLFPVGLLGGVLIESPQFTVKKAARAYLLFLQRVFFIFSLAGGLAFFVLVREYFALEESWRRLQYQSAKIGKEERVAIPKVYLLTGLYELSYMIQLVPKKEMMSEDIERSRRVVTRYGWGNLLFKYALMAGLNGRIQDSKWALAMVCKTSSEKYCERAKNSWHELRDEFPGLIDFDSAVRG